MASGTFHVHDDRLVSVEPLSAEVAINQPSEVALYVDVFEQLRGMAVYGPDARALIVRATTVTGPTDSGRWSAGT